MYEALRIEGYASATPCAGASTPPLAPAPHSWRAHSHRSSPLPHAGCVQLSLFWNVVNQSNLVAAADFPPPPGYAYVRPLAYALPLSSNASETGTEHRRI